MLLFNSEISHECEISRNKWIIINHTNSFNYNNLTSDLLTLSYVFT